uniref:Uncharacterized protein n=1 Tax=Avena sativa TaxID=4498 RepID=A0ACD5YI73_AVESA
MAMVEEQVACWCSLVLAVVLPLFLFKMWKRGDAGAANLPPSPWRLPVIGNLHQVMSRGPLLHRALADLARRLDAPLMYLKLGEVPVVVASSPEAAREITKTHDLSFATRPWSPSVRVLVADGDAQGLMFARYGALWRQVRKTCVVELLNSRRVRSCRRVREEEARRLVAAVTRAAAAQGEATVEVGELISAAMTDLVVRAVIGDRFDRSHELLQVIKEGKKIASDKISLCDLFPSSWIASLLSGTTRRAEENSRKMFELMDCVIRQHQERRAAASGNLEEEEEEDTVDVLLRLQKDGGHEVPFTMGTIRSVIRDLFNGGGETAVIEWVMAQLMRNPRVMQKAQAELRESFRGRRTVTEDDLVNVRYLKLVIKETLRLNTPVPLLLPRECRETCKVMGYDVPKGTTVFVNAWAIGRDPKCWADAEDFIPERFESGGAVDFNGTDFEFIPFGAGRRMCPGMALGLASHEIVLASLLYHFDWEFPAGVSPSEMDMTEEMGVTMTSRMKNGLHLRPIVRVPLQAAS